MLLALLPRLFVRCTFVAFAGLLGSVALLAQTPSALDGFDPNVNGNVFALATQADGRLLVAGQFTTIGGVPRNNLARLNADGSVDESFDPNPNAPVRALLVQPDGRIVIGGDFASLHPHSRGSAIARGRVARLNADGSVEASFVAMIGGEPLPGGGQLRPQVFALARQADGSILVGGSFGTVQPANAAVIFTRRNLLRLTAGGGIDTAFDPNPNGMVLALALHVDNKIIVGGGFTAFQPAGAATATTRNRIARLNANGSIDSEFNPNANNGVTALAIQRDGKILLGGFFTALQPIGEPAPANRSHLARLNPNGTLDSEFIARAEGNVTAIAVQPDGGILVGGPFTGVWGRGGSTVTRGFAARFNIDGSLDNTFAPALNAQVDAFAFQPDGKIVIGGHFTRATPVGRTTAVVRNHLARLNADGSLDTHFELDPGGRPLVSITQADGKVVIGGSFTAVGGATHNFLARLNADGSVDSTYNPNLNGRVYTMAYDAASNKVIIGGDFTTVNGETRNHIARINPNGSVDSEFNPNINGRVGVIARQSDGRLVVGGAFSTVQPIGATSSTQRTNLLRLNANGTLDTSFDPSPNSSVSALAIQSDGKIIVGGMFNVLTPGFGSSTTATSTGRSFIARVNSDGTLDTTFNPNTNGQVSTIAVQSDNKIIIGGAFTALLPNGTGEPVTRNRIARLNTDGTIDATYNPNANGNVLALALQPDGKLLIGGAFISLQPNGASDWTLRKYAARLNTDGTVDSTFDLDLDEQAGNRVDSIRVQDGRAYLGGSFTSLSNIAPNATVPVGTPARIVRRNFVRILTASNVVVDAGFDPGAGGSTNAVVNALAVQADNKIIAVGSFSDLGGAKSTNIARFRPEGTPDPEFSGALSTDGPVNAVAVRPSATAAASQLAGFAWLNANGTLRSAFANNGATRLSGRISAIAVQPDGRVLLGGSFTNLSNTTGGNLVRFNANGTLDTSFNPNPNGEVAGIVVQSDGRIVIVGSFTTVGGVVRNRIARIDANGSVDTTYDPNANARINAVVLESSGNLIIGGSFTTLTPNLATTATNRNYLARVNRDGTVDAGYNPSPSAPVNALAVQGDGKVIAGGIFTSVAPNGATTATTRNGIARFNTDGTLDANFDPNANATINALVALPNGQIVIGGGFTTLQPNQTGTVFTRSNLARVNSDGTVDATFNPNPNGPVTTLALQPGGSLLVAGMFTALQPNATGAAVARNRLVRLNANGSIDLNFNPDLNGNVVALASGPEGAVLLGGEFTALQLIGSIVVGGNFATIGGVPARNLAMLNDNGSVNATFQPRPDGAVNALLVQTDGKVIAGGAFRNIAGTARSGLARFNADGSFDSAFNAATDINVEALALQSNGRILVAGATTTATPSGRLVRLNADGSLDASFANATARGLGVAALAVQADGKILAVLEGSGVRHTLVRLNADGSADSTFTPVAAPSGFFDSLAVQADGRVIVSGDFTVAGVSRLARLNANGSVDSSFNVAPNGRVTAVALQSDGRLVAGGRFTRIAGQSRVGIARLAATSPAAQMLGVTANRGTVVWTRTGTAGELSAVIFERSPDRITWTRLGEGTRVENTANWQLTGLTLPASGVFYVRARGIAPSSGGTSSGVYELVREFNFANPVPGATQSNAPTTAATPIAFDPFTGIASRATLAVVPGEGTVEIFAANSLETGSPGSARLANLSTRGRVSAESPLLLGFAIAGSEPRRVLVRAIGPSLAGFGVSDSVAATRLQVYDAAGALLASNEGWGSSAELVQTAAATGAFPLSAGSADSAAVLSLAPGAYTIEVLDTRGRGGVALAEIYDAGSGAGSRLVNVSSRGAAGSGNAALISGFVLAGEASQRVLLRAVGPGLIRFGAPNTVTDPALALYDAAGVELGGNDNWVSSVTSISGAATAAGAFALEPGSKDAAVLATLPAGAYTTQVTASGTGTALLEIYQLQ